MMLCTGVPQIEGLGEVAFGVSYLFNSHCLIGRSSTRPVIFRFSLAESPGLVGHYCCATPTAQEEWIGKATAGSQSSWLRWEQCSPAKHQQFIWTLCRPLPSVSASVVRQTYHANTVNESTANRAAGCVTGSFAVIDCSRTHQSVLSSCWARSLRPTPCCHGLTLAQARLAHRPGCAAPEGSQ